MFKLFKRKKSVFVVRVLELEVTASWHLDMGPMLMLPTIIPSHTDAYASSPNSLTADGRRQLSNQSTSIYYESECLIKVEPEDTNLHTHTAKGSRIDGWPATQCAHSRKSKTIKFKINFIIFKLKFIVFIERPPLSLKMHQTFYCISPDIFVFVFEPTNVFDARMYSVSGDVLLTFKIIVLEYGWEREKESVSAINKSWNPLKKFKYSVFVCVRSFGCIFLSLRAPDTLPSHSQSDR